MDLHVNETVKEYLLTISKKYEFEYMFRGGEIRTSQQS